MSEAKTLDFSSLWVGDRFTAYGHLWTKLGPDTARQHSAASVNLGDLGYGYLGDSICSFDLEEPVEFQPPSDTIAAWNRRQPISELTEIQKGAINVAECMAESPAMISDMAWSAAMRHLLEIIAHLTGKAGT